MAELAVVREVAAQVLAEQGRAYGYAHYGSLRDAVAARWTRDRYQARADSEAAALIVAEAESVAASLAEAEADETFERVVHEEELAKAKGEEKVRVARASDPSHRRLEEELAVVVGQREEREKVVRETQQALASLTTSLSTVRNLHKV